MIFLKKNILYTALGATTFLCACSSKPSAPSNSGTGRIVATAYAENLYYNDIQTWISADMTAEDSVKTVNNIVQKWLRDRVLLHVATDKASTTPEIDALVEDYRRSLLLQRYKTEVAASTAPADTAIASEELRSNYDSLKTALKNETTLVLVDFVAIPANWKSTNTFTALWAKKDNTAELQAFCTENAEDYAVKKWLRYDELAAKMPKAALQESSLAAGKTYSIKQPVTHYYIRVHELQKKGDTPNFEAARARLRAIILQQRQTANWSKIVENAYQKALKSGDIDLK